MCEETLFEKKFIDKVVNGSCKLSNEILAPFEKCGKFMNYKDVFPYPDDEFDLCYSIHSNRFFFKQDFENLFLPSFNFYGPIIYTTGLNFILIIGFIFITIIPELVRDFKTIFISKKFKSFFRYSFSIRHQILLLLMISLIPHFISFMLFISIGIFYDFGPMISFACVTIAFFQVTILWAHICIQSDTLESNISTRLV